MKTNLYPSTPPTRLDTWLLGLPADHLAALLIGLVVLAFLGGMAVSIFARVRREQAAQRVSSVINGTSKRRTS